MWLWTVPLWKREVWRIVVKGGSAVPSVSFVIATDGVGKRCHWAQCWKNPKILPTIIIIFGQCCHFGNVKCYHLAQTKWLSKAALAALYLPLSGWLTVTSEFWTERVTSDIWSERCLDNKTKRQKYEKTKTKQRVSYKNKLWCQGSFALLRCFCISFLYLFLYLYLYLYLYFYL